MQTNGIDFNPSKNPAVLDTMTWNRAAALDQVKKHEPYLTQLAAAVGSAGCVRCVQGAIEPAQDGFEVVRQSVCLGKKPEVGTHAHAVAKLPDGQRVFLGLFPEGTQAPPLAIGVIAGGKVVVAPVTMDTVKKFVTECAPQYGPKAFGSVPRLGIGNRQSVTVWPGIFEGIRAVGGPAEVIQNSAFRELAPMDFILAPPGGEATYLPGHGTLNIGHTGSSIEGLWLYGVVSAIENGFMEPFGADLDHVPVKEFTEEGISKAKKLLDCGRYYTFFTLDTSYLYDFSQTDLSKKYGEAIEAGKLMYDYIEELKGDEPFDLEFSLDEGPEITRPEEQEYVLSELTKRGVVVNFVAPNVGFEKRLDYRKPDGLAGLESRVRQMSEMAAEYGAILDFHSGSDKAGVTYQTISKAAGGKIKLKVSGRLQLILSEVLADMDPAFFREWWDWTLASATEEAKQGSEIARKYVDILNERKAKEGSKFKPSPKDLFFTDFSFGMVGAKDEKGNFLYRQKFYSLKPEVQEEYNRRNKEYIVQLAEDLGLRRK